jgi:integrase
LLCGIKNDILTRQGRAALGGYKMPIYKVDGAKKDGLQKYNVRINYISRTDGKPKQLTRTAYGHEAAKELERQLEKNVRESDNSFAKITIQQLFDEYEIAKKHEIKHSSLEEIKTNYKLYIKPTLGDKRLRKLTTPILQSWKLLISDKKLSVVTKKKIYGFFRAILNYAVKMEYLKNNPLLKIGNFREPLRINHEMKVYTAQEFTKFIAVAKQYASELEKKSKSLFEWDFYVFFNIAFYTGLRKGEIYALRWSDIGGAFLSVKRSITQKHKQGDMETAPKNISSIRVLQMPTPLIEVLDEHRKRQKKLKNFNSSFRICGGDRCIRDSTVTNKNVIYASIAGLDRIRIHDFRHSHVSVLAKTRE